MPQVSPAHHSPGVEFARHSPNGCPNGCPAQNRCLPAARYPVSHGRAEAVLQIVGRDGLVEEPRLHGGRLPAFQVRPGEVPPMAGSRSSRGIHPSRAGPSRREPPPLRTPWRAREEQAAAAAAPTPPPPGKVPRSGGRRLIVHRSGYTGIRLYGLPRAPQALVLQITVDLPHAILEAALAMRRGAERADVPAQHAAVGIRLRLGIGLEVGDRGGAG